MKPQVIHTSTFIETTAEYIVATALKDLKDKGRFILGLCGGNTPRAVYSKVAKIGSAVDWTKVIITFGDERCVAPEHSESNYRMAKESLLDAIGIPPENVCRMQGELEPELAAKSYETQLLNIGGKNSNQTFVHDLLLLGMGGDGHTASLFPDSKALTESDRLVVSNFVQKLNTNRLTFTFKLINSSRRVCFLVNDSGKKDVVDEILTGASNYPAGRVAATEQTVWFLGYEG